MSLSSAMLEILLAEGLDGAAIVRVAKAVEAREAEEKAARNATKREQNAERQRRFKAKKRVGNASNADNAGNALLPPNDIYSNPPVPSEANASPPPIEEKLVSAWNAGPAANGARLAKRLDGSRRTMLKARLRESSESELLEAVANIAASRFHCGENDRNWRASLGWMLKAENFLKALEMAPQARGPTAEVFDLLADASRYAKPPQPINTEKAA